jgi:hypothetical protein
LPSNPCKSNILQIKRKYNFDLFWK